MPVVWERGRRASSRICPGLAELDGATGDRAVVAVSAGVAGVGIERPVGD